VQSTSSKHKTSQDLPSLSDKTTPPKKKKASDTIITSPLAARTPPPPATSSTPQSPPEAFPPQAKMLTAYLFRCLAFKEQTLELLEHTNEELALEVEAL
jgi:hypothetical protein